MPEIKYPHITVALDIAGPDGNAFMIMGETAKAMKRDGVNPDEIAQYRAEAMSGSYDELIETTKSWIDFIEI